MTSNSKRERNWSPEQEPVAKKRCIDYDLDQDIFDRLDGKQDNCKIIIIDSDSSEDSSDGDNDYSESDRSDGDESDGDSGSSSGSESEHYDDNDCQYNEEGNTRDEPLYRIWIEFSKDSQNISPISSRRIRSRSNRNSRMGNNSDSDNDDRYTRDYDDDDLEVEKPKCYGPNCDHRYLMANVPDLPKHLDTISPDYKIKLSDLIELGAAYHCVYQKYFGRIDLSRLARLYEPLTKLNEMIGMKKIKETFTEQIIYFMLDLEPNPTELLHTVLVGPPGVGKSHVVDILAEIYLKMGYLTRDVIKRVKINDLKGKYVGHTAPLTQEAIDDAMGGVLLIDEAYSLGSEERLDVFSKELIDTLNRNLTERAGKFICIIVGYEDQIESCLFAHNEGLKSRFRFRFEIEPYDASELLEIFSLKANDKNWKFYPFVDTQKVKGFFEKNLNSFKYYGRDIETLLFHTKMAYSNRILFDKSFQSRIKCTEHCECSNCLDCLQSENESKNIDKVITYSDIEAGYRRFTTHNKIKDQDQVSFSHMYL